MDSRTNHYSHTNSGPYSNAGSDTHTDAGSDDDTHGNGPTYQHTTSTSDLNSYPHVNANSANLENLRQQRTRLPDWGGSGMVS